MSDFTCDPAILAVYRNSSLSPMLSVRRGKEALAFYQAAFGAKVLFRAGEVREEVIAKLAIGNAEFWISDEDPDHLNFSPESIGGTSVRLIVVLDDPHAAVDYAVAAGAKVLCPVVDEDYGWRIGRIQDPFGHIWEIGKPI
jgi:PhnB protein